MEDKTHLKAVSRTVNVNTLNNTICVNWGNIFGNNGKNRGKSYSVIHRMSPQRKSYLKNVCRLMEKEVSGYVLFFTITTCQSETGLMDGYYLDVLKKFLDNFRDFFIHYIWVAERQKNGSIHFHIIVKSKYSRFYFINEKDGEVLIKNWCQYLNKRMPQTGTNAINLSKKSQGAPEEYVTKQVSEYVTKGAGEEQYFYCRVSQISRSLVKVYKENIWKYKFKTEISEYDISEMPVLWANEFISIHTLHSQK